MKILIPLIFLSLTVQASKIEHFKFGIMSQNTNGNWLVIKRTSNIPLITQADDPDFRFGFGFLVPTQSVFHATVMIPVDIEDGGDRYIESNIPHKQIEKGVVRPLTFKEIHPEGLYKLRVFIDGECEVEHEFNVSRNFKYFPNTQTYRDPKLEIEFSLPREWSPLRMDIGVNKDYLTWVNSDMSGIVTVDRTKHILNKDDIRLKKSEVDDFFSDYREYEKKCSGYVWYIQTVLKGSEERQERAVHMTTNLKGRTLRFTLAVSPTESSNLDDLIEIITETFKYKP